MLNYSLLENLLTPAANAFMAQPVNVRSYGMAEIAKRILARNPGLGLSQLNAALEEFIEEICIIIADGGAVNTPLFNTQPSIAGVFQGATDTYDAKRHRIKTNLSGGTRMKRATSGIKAQKVQTPDPVPFILEVNDMLSETTNELLTPGGVIQVWGGRLKLATANPDNGIFLLNDQNEAVKLAVVIENKPARLIAMLPANLPAGAYTMEVRTTFLNSAKESKTMKTGKLNKELTAVIDTL